MKYHTDYSVTDCSLCFVLCYAKDDIIYNCFSSYLSYNNELYLIRRCVIVLAPLFCCNNNNLMVNI